MKILCIIVFVSFYIIVVFTTSTGVAMPPMKKCFNDIVFGVFTFLQIVFEIGVDEVA